MTNLDLSTLSSALEDEIHSTELLLETLTSERSALGEMDPDNLQALTEVKTDQVTTLEKQTRYRMQLTPTIDQQTLINWLNECTDSAAQQVLTLFSTLLENGRQLARKNRVNGLTLRQGQRNVRSAITLLTGNKEKQADLYDAAGGPGHSIKRHPLGTA